MGYAGERSHHSSSHYDTSGSGYLASLCTDIINCLHVEPSHTVCRVSIQLDGVSVLVHMCWFLLLSARCWPHMGSQLQLPYRWPHCYSCHCKSHPAGCPHQTPYLPPRTAIDTQARSRMVHLEMLGSSAAVVRPMLITCLHFDLTITALAACQWHVVRDEITCGDGMSCCLVCKVGHTTAEPVWIMLVAPPGSTLHILNAFRV